MPQQSVVNHPEPTGQERQRIEPPAVVNPSQAVQAPARKATKKKSSPRSKVAAPPPQFPLPEIGLIPTVRYTKPALEDQDKAMMHAHTIKWATGNLEVRTPSEIPAPNFKPWEVIAYQADQYHTSQLLTRTKSWSS